VNANIRTALERLIARLDETNDRTGPVPAWIDSYCAAREALEAEPEVGEVGEVGERQRKAVIAAVAEALGESAYDCLRVWAAWGVGYMAMGPDDFALVAEDSDRLAEIADAAIEAICAVPATPPAPETFAEALAARPLLERVARLGDCIGAHTVGEIATISDRAAAWLRDNPPGQPVAMEPRGCPTPGACSCVEPAPPAPKPGEVGELVEWLRNHALDCHDLGINDWAAQSTRAADLLQDLSAFAPSVAPVAVSEQPWEWEEWCDEQGRCWAWSIDMKCWQLLDPRILADWVLLLPADAIALPAPQAEEVQP
jgi:hypothetical protein